MGRRCFFRRGGARPRPGGGWPDREEGGDKPRPYENMARLAVFAFLPLSL